MPEMPCVHATVSVRSSQRSLSRPPHGFVGDLLSLTMGPSQNLGQQGLTGGRVAVFLRLIT
eukprot:41208-Eustigmatos_ZCMA.PRE.1